MDTHKILMEIPAHKQYQKNPTHKYQIPKDLVKMKTTLTINDVKIEREIMAYLLLTRDYGEIPQFILDRILVEIDMVLNVLKKEIIILTGEKVIG